MMDSDTRMAVRRARDVEVRRRLGLQAKSHVRRTVASKSRKWTDADIRAAVGRLTGGRAVSRRAYIALRREQDPNLYPSHNTVIERCPDLFKP